jgi:hypothetical protein
MGAPGEVFDDFIKIFRLHMGVPAFLGIKHHVGAFLTSAETHIRLDFDVLQSPGRDSFLQFDHEGFRTTRLAIDIQTN